VKNVSYGRRRPYRGKPRGRGRSPSGRRYGGKGRGLTERKMYKVICSECGKEAEVPFKPDESKPVYCRECYQKKTPSQRTTAQTCPHCGKPIKIELKPE